MKGDGISMSPSAESPYRELRVVQPGFLIPDAADVAVSCVPELAPEHGAFLFPSTLFVSLTLSACFRLVPRSLKNELCN